MWKSSLILFIGSLFSLVKAEPGIIDDMLQAAVGENIPFLVVDIGAEESVVETAEKRERESITLSLENALLRLYIINNELDSMHLQHTAKELDRVIRNLKVVQERIRGKPLDPFPLQLAGNPDYGVSYIYEVSSSDDDDDDDDNDGLVVVDPNSTEEDISASDGNNEDISFMEESIIEDRLTEESSPIEIVTVKSYTEESFPEERYTEESFTDENEEEEDDEEEDDEKDEGEEEDSQIYQSQEEDRNFWKHFLAKSVNGFRQAIDFVV